nr:uncharacterized protein LOC106042267 isoform X5 [Anser cygnoides]
MFCFDCRKSRGIELNALLLPHFSEIQMKRRLLTGETHSAAIVDPALKEKLKQNNVTLESEYKLSSKITKLQNSCFGQFHIQGFIKLQAYKKPC